MKDGKALTSLRVSVIDMFLFFLVLLIFLLEKIKPPERFGQKIQKPKPPRIYIQYRLLK